MGIVCLVLKSDINVGKLLVAVLGIFIVFEDIEVMKEVMLLKVMIMNGVEMVLLLNGLFEMNLILMIVMLNCCELEVIGGTRVDDLWIILAGDEVIVRVIV